MAYAMRDPRTKKLTGRWRADGYYKDPDGAERTWRKTYDSKKEAEGAEAYFRATGNPPPSDVQAPRGSFSDVAAKFEARNQAWCASRVNKGRLEAAVLYFKHRDVAHIRYEALCEYVDYLRPRTGRGDQGSNRTMKRYVDAVMLVLRFALKLELLQGMPARPEIANTGETRDIVSLTDERSIIAAMEAAGHSREAFYVRLLAATGMRTGEVDSLKADQVMLPEQEEYTGVQLTGSTKTKNHDRWVPIVPEIARPLKVYLAAGTLPNRTQVYRIFTRVLKAVGGNQKLNLHCFRHTTITRLRMSGADSMDIAKIVGHSSGGGAIRLPKMTLGYYHPEQAHLFRVAEKVQRAVGELAPSAEVVPLKSFAKSA